jgi:hypothetical protein
VASRLESLQAWWENMRMRMLKSEAGCIALCCGAPLMGAYLTTRKRDPPDTSYNNATMIGE